MTVLRVLSLGLAMLALGGPACADDATTFSLVRNSALDPSMRVHVASFDTAHGEAYNQENCNLVANLMQQQEGVKTRFWCEQGPFKP